MRTFFHSSIKKYFGPEHDFRVQIFNLFAFAGVIISCVMCLQAIASQTGWLDVGLKACSGIFSLGMVMYCERTKQYERTYLVAIVGVFVLFFSMLFLTGGGYQSGITSFFVFAVVFTTCMIEGKIMCILVTVELVLYVLLCLIDYAYLNLAQAFVTEFELLVSIVTCFVVSSLAVGVTTYQQVQLYKRQQEKVDEQNRLLEQVNRNKTEFLANTSHEMRTPLTVISVNIQMVRAILARVQEKEENEEMAELLSDAQEEIMRLSRMVGGMLSLNSISEAGERHQTDFSALLLNVTDLLRLVFLKNNNEMILEQSEKVTAFCNADLMSQVLINILQNANHHTKNDTIHIKSFVEHGNIHVHICDNGSGISKEMLPNVFKRGVSEGGTGFGLYLCKTVVNSHGGDIWVESEQGKGCTVSFTLPVYQGQYEEGK